MSHIDVTFGSIGHHWRVAGEFTPGRSARRDSPAEPAQWDGVRVSMIAEGGVETPDLSELLESLHPTGRTCTALTHVLEMAELTWLRERECAWEAA